MTSPNSEKLRGEMKSLSRCSIRLREKSSIKFFFNLKFIRGYGFQYTIFDQNRLNFAFFPKNRLVTINSHRLTHK